MARTRNLSLSLSLSLVLIVSCVVFVVSDLANARPAYALGGAKQISAGAEHTCAIIADGSAYCWGFGNSGRLGYGGSDDQHTPTLVTGGLSWKSIAAGGYNTCGIASDDRAYCWGDGGAGKNGDGLSTSYLTPTLVSGGLTFTSIDNGGLHVCAVATGQQLYCWGYNNHGQIGDGTTSNALTPYHVTGNWVAVSAGDSSTCAINADTNTYCWGEGTTGRLGTGNTNEVHVPTLVQGGYAFVSITVGESDACALTASGQGHCWGDARGSGTASNIPLPIASAPIFTTISASSYHTCGTGINAQLYCWGDNFYGELGDGTNNWRGTPSTISSSQKFASVSNGNVFSCGLSSIGVIYCWGANHFGKLGTNSTTNSNLPLVVWPVAYANTDISTVVDASLGFAVAGRAPGAGACNGVTPTQTTSASSVSFGSLTSGNRVGAQDLTVSTNARSGFVLYIRYSQPLQNASHTFPDAPGTNAVPTAFAATESFGYTTDQLARFNTDKWAALQTSNDVIGTSSGPTTNTGCVGYQVRVDNVTPAGTYATTITYTAIGNF